MEKEFVPYELAVKLKTLGFDEPCLGYYTHNEKLCSYGSNEINIEYLFCTHKDIYKTYSLAPTFSQAFRWFRENHGAVCEIIRKEDYNCLEFMGWIYIDDKKININSYWRPLSYEEAELACLEKLIELTFKSE
jgi:hypothetical protein